ncbi:ACP synthase [Melittangium boletus]|uniref:ACP synthase n=1 Tax=Melittangium boletus DSM 14713 TaxID=1294270 RepID=A0A250IKW7_9BACT|nr:ACP synthase [Melittangium boletus]ATB32409.1 ACP synthase [Melittangium boletus DSM 14713]
MSAHLTEWTVRRLRAGELTGADEQQARAHVATCTPCAQVLQELEAEQARFEAQVPFERFVAGVQGAVADAKKRPDQPRVNGFLVAVAATVLLAVTVRPLLATEPINRLKGGGASADLRIGGGGPQRSVQPGDIEVLLPGERARLGYVAGPYHFVLAVSVDDAGEFSTLYAQEDRSLPVEPSAERRWLPESLEFTGKGQERVMVLLSDEPLRVDAVREAVLGAWERAGGKLPAMTTLGIQGEEIHWLLRKP